jgi:hypothetical protein
MHHQNSQRMLLTILILALSISGDVLAGYKASALPNVENPKKLILENDSLKMEINFDWQLLIAVFKYKPENLEFVKPGKIVPLLQIDNPFILNNVGFPIKTAKIEETENSAIIKIDAKSNYVENPFILKIKLAIGERSQIDLKIELVNEHKSGYNDLYRENRTWVTPGLPWLSCLSPDPGGTKRVVYPSNDEYKMEVIPDNSYENFAPSEDKYFPTGNPLTLSFYRNPGLPIILEYPDIDMGLFIHKNKTDMKWVFDSAQDALWPSSRLTVKSGETLTIFDGTLGVFSGDWHQAFNWFRNKIRSEFDFTYYNRPEYQTYRKDFTAFHSFIYNHKLYDPIKNSYRIREYLTEVKEEYDGFDQFYFWHAYPRVGVDPRDQFDLFRDLPGGLEGLKELVQSAQSMNTHVYLAYNPWDKIGKKEDMYGEMADIAGTVGADGLLLDTMDESDVNFRQKMDAYNRAAQFVTEGRPEFDGLVITTSSWDHKLTRESMPYVDLLRFILPEHRIFQINRWDRDRIPLIKKAIFNTTGYIVWNDIFGEINIHTWDEKIMISRYHRAMHDFAHVLNTPRNEPLVENFVPNLYVNGFYHEEMHFYSLFQDVHNFVTHHKEHRVIGPLFDLDVPEGWHAADIWNKRPVEIRNISGERTAFLPNEMPEDIGCIVVMPELIQVRKENENWIAEVAGSETGTLELIGVDIGMRNQVALESKAPSPLIFNNKSAKPTTAGYVMVQYRNEGKEVKDVVLIKTGF